MTQINIDSEKTLRARKESQVKKKAEFEILSRSKLIKINSRMEQVPLSAQGAFKSAHLGYRTFAQSINAKCMDCCVYDRSEIAGCRSVWCPL